MERGSAKHSARQDDALAEEVEGTLPPHGSNSEEWDDPEPPADDDPAVARDMLGASRIEEEARTDRES